MPLAFANMGLVLGTIFTIALGLLYWHCVHMLVSSNQKLCKETRSPTLNYQETLEKAFESGPDWLQKGTKLAKSVIGAGLVMVGYDNCIYIFYAASVLKIIFLHAFEIDWGIKMFILLVGVPGRLFQVVKCNFLFILLSFTVLIMIQIRDLKFLSPITAIANLLILTGIVIILVYIFKGPMEYNDKDLVASTGKWPRYFSFMILAYKGIGIVLPIEHTMKNPQALTGKFSILTYVMVILIFFYVFLGFFGYARYGGSVERLLTLSLPQDENLSLTAQFLMAIALILSTTILSLIALDNLWKMFEPKVPEKRHKIGKTILGTLTNATKILIVILTPDIDALIGLLGFIISTLSFLFPAMIQSAHLYPNYGKYNWMLWKNILILIFGAFIFFNTAYFGFSAFIRQYTD